MTLHLPRRGVIAETNSWGEATLPPKAERVHGKPGKTDRAAMYLDREGKVQTVHFRMPEPQKPSRKVDDAGEDDVVMARPRPDVTRRGIAMIGDFRTDALHDALERGTIEDDTLMALLVLALAGRNITVASGAGDDVYGFARMERHAVRLVADDGTLAQDMVTLRSAARAALIDALSARVNRSDSGIVARIAGVAIGADGFLPNMGTEDFLDCLSRAALERSCKETPVLPRARVRETRAALVEHFATERFVHPAALFAPDAAEIAKWLSSNTVAANDDEDVDAAAATVAEDPADQEPGEFLDAAE